MAVRIGVGGEFFDRLREDKCYYMDKTELLYELVHDADNAVTLFTRPRRFGKTLTMSMMESFFDIKADPDEDADTVSLRIPNREIAGIFQDTVMKYFTDHVNADEQKAMMESLWTGDEGAASEAISRLLWQTISYMDYHEDYYHAFLAGIFVGRGYEVESNRERGLGRPDIQLTDDVNRRVLIIEAKKSDRKENMEHDCKEALQQIMDREYARNLDGYTVICYGIAFFRKSALVKKL